MGSPTPAPGSPAAAQGSRAPGDVRLPSSRMPGGCPAAHLALLGVGQHLVLLPGVEEECLHGEGDKLFLEGGTLVGTEEQALVPVAE